MKKKLLSVLLCTAMAASLLAGCGSSSGTAASSAPASSAPAASEAASSGTAASTAAAADTSAAGKYKIYLITMDQMDQHWVNVDKGCQKAVAELGNVDYKWLAPDTKDDTKQIECVNNAVADNANAIIIAANGPDSITSALQEAVDKGIKIVYVDSAANLDAEATFSTDNEAAGKTAGQTMIDKLKADGVTSGDIGIIGVNSATASCVAREKGFRAAFDGTDFNLLETQYGEGDAAKSKDIAANYITSGVAGIFGVNEGSTTGTGNAIQEAGGKVVGVGFDKSDTILQLISDGYLLATMAQNPDVMGYDGMKAAVDALSGKDLGGAVTDTGVTVVTKDNVADYMK